MSAMNTSEYHSPALGLVVNSHKTDDTYIARKCVKGGAPTFGIPTYQIATNIRPGEKGGLAIDWIDCSEEEFNDAINPPKIYGPVMGSRVQRTSGAAYQIGNTGSVVGIQDLRARVMWDGDKRTWVAFHCLKVIS